ncbi:membrane-associated calcum-binding protein [Cryptosporidium ubiquitum]|uniref:Membrane-associated calcum-binding protein n=1 Tax=Cryptosporidium ubiquitum TaxID=857276 RepID=A0A1J4MEE6_9CRYT|nr:membrane-associated calcum-binding protein [Cryptosporidium ubiquitum]OII71396.1 membrane-associated calcum-binding protein [Cryptosporidium ubiquitum]
MRSLNSILSVFLVLIVLIFVGFVHGINESPDLLKLVSDKKMYDEWLKTMTVSEEVILERFNTLLGIIDLNKDGVLDKDELTKWIRFVSERSSLKEVEAEFKILDKDKDGKISSEEFVNHFISGDDEASSKEKLELEKFYQELFKEVDSDKDGYLNVEDYYYLTNYYNLSKELFIKVNSFLSQNDKNGDGVIDKEEIKQIKEENAEVITGDPDKLVIFGVDMSNENELSVKKIIFSLRSQEIQDAITDAYHQLVDVYNTRKDAKAEDPKSSSIPIDFVRSNHIVYIQSILADYGDVFKYPHDIFVGVHDKDYDLSSEKCTELFGENERPENSDEENEFDHDDFETDDNNPNDDVEISDDMIQRLISLMGNSGLGDIDDGSRSMFDVFAHKAEREEGGDLAGMEEILKMLQSLIGSKMGDNAPIPEDHENDIPDHEDDIPDHEDDQEFSSSKIKDEL